MSENEVQVQANLWKVFDIYKSAGVIDEAQIVEDVAFFTLAWKFTQAQFWQQEFLSEASPYADQSLLGLVRWIRSLNSSMPPNFNLGANYVALTKVIDKIQEIIQEIIPKEEQQVSSQSLFPSISKELNGLQLQEVAEILFRSFDQIPDLGEWFDQYLIPRLTSSSKGGRYATPRHLINFMAKVVGLKSNDTLVDFACGTGGMLVANGKLKKATGVEISPNMARLAFTNLILHEQKHDLHLGNAFEDSISLSSDEQFGEHSDSVESRLVKSLCLVMVQRAKALPQFVKVG